MVFPGEMTTTTATRPEQRSKTLHNFPLPNLWGNQRLLKCAKIESNENGGDHRLRRRSPPARYSDSMSFRFGGSDHRRSRDAAFKSGGSEEGIEEFRVKLMSDLKTVRDKITQSMFNKDVIEGAQEEEEDISGSGSGSGSGQEKEVSPVKPWNLRKRRAAASKEAVSISQFDKGIPIEEKVVVTPLFRGGGGGGVVEAETKKRPKFAVKLSKKEIEEDFIGVLGHRPPRRPKKRPRTVQKKLDSLYPGLYLTEVTLDAYKVPEETKR